MTNLRGVIDPFNGGSTETLNSHPVADESRAAALAIMRRFTGSPDLWDMLGAFGLAVVAQEMLLSRRVALGYVPPTPEPLCLVPEPPAARTAPVSAPLRYPHLPAHRQGAPMWVHEKRKADAITRAQTVITEMRAARELPAFDGDGNSLPRCTRRIHYKIGPNVRVRANRTRACVPCDRIRQAWSTLRQYGVTF